jgi:hypothetical protein
MRRCGLSHSRSLCPATDDRTLRHCGNLIHHRECDDHPLEHRTPENIDAEIESAVGDQTDFHQFMIYTPIPGTPLYQEMAEPGRLLLDIDPADIHAQFKVNCSGTGQFRVIDSKRFLDWAFWRDFQSNAPSFIAGAGLS